LILGTKCGDSEKKWGDCRLTLLSGAVKILVAVGLVVQGYGKFTRSLSDFW